MSPGPPNSLPTGSQTKGLDPFRSLLWTKDKPQPPGKRDRLHRTPRVRRLPHGLAWFTTPEGLPAINPIGQILGAIIMFGVLGFLPAFVVAKILNAANLLRVPVAVELAGLDTHAYGDVYPYEEQRETPFETVEREEARELVPDLYRLRVPEPPDEGSERP
jgi:hypothetical protein